MALLVPRWAESLLCRYNMRCKGGECEQLHLSSRTGSCKVPESRGKLIVCAGPERSGSTWLFNALRLLLEGSGERVHSYWLSEITSGKLRERGFGRTDDPVNLLVKTHDWSDSWDPATADAIILTERDICGVMNSYLRAGWQPYDFEYLKAHTRRYLSSHRRWKTVAHAVIPFEALADVGQRELQYLNQLQELLKLQAQVNDAKEISAAIAALPVPLGGGPDPLTKLWPRHIGTKDELANKRPRLTAEECQGLRAYVQSIC